MKFLLSFFVLFITTICLFAQDIAYNENQPFEYETQNFHTGKVKNEFNSSILKKRLLTLNSKTQFNVLYNDAVEKSINLHLKENKNDVSNLMDKAALYFPVFEKHLRDFNLPKEIKYLAVIESKLEPSAKSHVGAKGLWQFMSYTGKEYGLKINNLVDERLDAVKATKAACEYLSKLYETFNDWDLALAAYNAGPSNVKKAIRKAGGQKDYWKIRKYLPKETRKYIPKFYATLYLFEYGYAHNISPSYSQITHNETQTIEINNNLNFKEIANHFKIDYKIIHQLNPQYKQGVILASNEEKKFLVLPKSTIEIMVPKQSKIYLMALQLSKKVDLKQNSKTKNSTKYYTVKKGDSLWRISRLFPKTTINKIRNWNNLWDVSYLKPGTKIKILTN